MPRSQQIKELKNNIENISILYRKVCVLYSIVLILDMLLHTTRTLVLIAWQFAINNIWRNQTFKSFITPSPLLLLVIGWSEIKSSHFV